MIHEVKCPKCRFRFDVDCPPGQEQLYCACPRCGTPFDYLVPGQPDKAQNRPEGKTPQVEIDAPAPRSQGFDEGNHEGRINGNATENLEDTGTTVAHKNPSETGRSTVLTPSPLLHRQQTAGYGRIFCLAFLIIAFFGLLSLLLRNCTQQQEPDDSMDKMVSDTVLSKTDRSVRELDTRQTLPSWVYGVWRRETNFGNMTLVIGEKNIVERVGDRVARGVYTYRNDSIIGYFSEGITFVYRLDQVRRRIDAGNSLFMTKNSDLGRSD